MKKIALLILALSLVLVCALALASCKKECEHDYVKDEAASTAATCDVAGKNVLKCSICGDVQEEDVAALGHKYGVKKVTVAVTCLVNGEKAKVCSTCGAKDDVEVVTAPGHHEWQETATIDTEANCATQTNGQKSIKCVNCDTIDTATIEVIPYAHNWSDKYTVDVVANCATMTAGSQSYHCTVCDAKDESSVCALPAAHTFGADATVTKAASIYNAGSKSGTCAVCSQAFTEVLPQVTVYPLVMKTMTKDNPPEIGELWTGEWAYPVNVADLIEETGKAFCPTEADPTGNDLFIEYSYLNDDANFGNKNAGAGYWDFRIYRGSNKVSLYFIDPEGTLPGEGPYTYLEPSNKGDSPKPACVRIMYGWNRIGIQVHQSASIVNDKIQYKWTVDEYLNGEKVGTTTFTDVRDAGIQNANLLLFTAEIDGGQIKYNAAVDEKLSALIVYTGNIVRSTSDVVAPVADVSVSIGKDFVTKVQPVKYDFDGGVATKNVQYGGADFVNYSNYKVIGADDPTDPVVTKDNYTFVAWQDVDGKRKAIWQAN